MGWRRMIRTVLVVLVCGALLLSVGSALAQEPADRDVDGTGQVGTGASGPARAVPSIRALSKAKGLSPVDLRVVVDETYCATGGVQCPTPGVGALPGNDNPTRLGIQVVYQGMIPIPGLPSATFTVFNPFVPAWTFSFT